ncbi:unnamed protein product [Durusdinium trenchii]|uniref:Uncharacterized protein n=1 Tax=Durusdinium trenchii TaxID=1381693 RepID=A0ABP0P141_9DINO
MGAVCATEPVALPLALALQEDDLSERLEALNLAECLEQEAARRARLQAAAFHALLALPELARGLCVLWGLKTSRRFAAVAKNGGKSVRGLLPNLHEEAVPQFYVMGGCLATTELASAQHYNPETNSWKLLPPMPTERRWCAGAALKGWLYVIGGQQEGHILPTAERFDVETGRWEALPDMPTCREACAVASCASYLYVLGGCQHDVPLSVAERLHVEAASTWPVAVAAVTSWPRPTSSRAERRRRSVGRGCLPCPRRAWDALPPPPGPPCTWPEAMQGAVVRWPSSNALTWRNTSGSS